MTKNTALLDSGGCPLYPGPPGSYAYETTQTRCLVSVNVLRKKT